jgi:hypothetical protein
MRKLGDHAHQALVVTVLLEAARQQADDVAVKVIVFGLDETGQPEPANAALERMKHGQVLGGRQVLQLDRDDTGQPRADIDRLGEVIELLPVDHVGLGKADFTAFLERVLDGGEEILVLLQRVRVARQQVQLIAVRIRHHEYRRMHARQQGAGSFQPFFGEAAMHLAAACTRSGLLRGRRCHSANIFVRLGRSYR